MLTLDLPRLGREGRLTLEADVPADDPLWEESGLRFDGAVHVAFEAHEAGSGEIVVRGRVDAKRVDECRRCLDPVRAPVELELTLVYAPADELHQDVEDESVREIGLDTAEIDLAEAVREELILATPRFSECRPECKGLCPVCGANRNETTCDCSLDEPDPRWDALRALKNE
jgi:uncharacterized protein